MVCGVKISDTLSDFLNFPDLNLLVCGLLADCGNTAYVEGATGGQVNFKTTYVLREQHLCGRVAALVQGSPWALAAAALCTVPACRNGPAAQSRQMLQLLHLKYAVQIMHGMSRSTLRCRSNPASGTLRSMPDAAWHVPPLLLKCAALHHLQDEQLVITITEQSASTRAYTAAGGSQIAAFFAADGYAVTNPSSALSVSIFPSYYSDVAAVGGVILPFLLPAKRHVVDPGCHLALRIAHLLRWRRQWTFCLRVWTPNGKGAECRFAPEFRFHSLVEVFWCSPPDADI